jgi:hypothetical protein
MAENEGRAALGAGKSATNKFLHLGLEYLLPIATFFVGLFTGLDTWGGVNAIWDALGGVNSTLQNDAAWPASVALFGGVFGVTGYAFWGMGSGGMVYTAVGRGLGGYFFGVALSYLVAWVGHKSVSDGLIDELVAGVRGL